MTSLISISLVARCCPHKVTLMPKGRSQQQDLLKSTTWRIPGATTRITGASNTTSSIVGPARSFHNSSLFKNRRAIGVLRDSDDQDGNAQGLRSPTAVARPIGDIFMRQQRRRLLSSQLLMPQDRCSLHTKRTYHAGKVQSEEMSEKDKKKALKAKAKEAMAASADEKEGAGDDVEAKKNAIKARLAAKKSEASEKADSTTAAEVAPPASSASDDEGEAQGKEETKATSNDNSNDSPPREYSIPELTRDAAKHKAGLSDPDRSPFQNPLHHNNPDYQNFLREDYASAEEFEAEAAKTKLPPLDKADGKIRYPLHIEELADECLHLTMLEMNELVERLEDHFGFQQSDLEPGSGGEGGSSSGDDGHDDDGGGGGGGGGGAAKTAFDIKLLSFDSKSKIKIIKEVRALTGLGLKEAKEVVDNVPSIIQKDVNQATANEIKVKLEELGAAVEIE